MQQRIYSKLKMKDQEQYELRFYHHSTKKKKFTRLNLEGGIMKIISIVILFLFCFAPASGPVFAEPAGSGTRVLSSRITAVTVYSDRAQVTRTATERLTAGEHRLIFEKLPAGLVPGSIQVNGTGRAELGDVKLNIERFPEIPDNERKKLYDEKTALEDQIAELDGKIEESGNEKVFLENIAKKLTGVTEKTQAGELDPERWVKMVDFYRNRNTDLDKEIHDTEKMKRDVKNRLGKVQGQIADIGSNEQKTKSNVEVLVRMKEAGDLLLNLSYMVQGATWQPVYDLRVSTREKKMNLTYNAVVRQNTTEPWEDVVVELSTAQPHIGGQQPELSPWYVNFYVVAPPIPATMRAPAMTNQMMRMRQTEELKEEARPVEDSGITKPTAAVQSNATSVVFEISGKNTIASDNLPHKVTVLIRDFPADFRYSAVPKLSPHAYLKTMVRNTSEFPLLPGKTNIFLDNNFVANAALSHVAPGEEFWTFLGVDDSIKVERKFVRKYQKEEGLFSKKTKIIYEYLTEITNNKKTEEELVLWDQLPITSQQDIAINLMEPQYDKDTPTLKKNELNYFEWLFKMKPGEKIKLPFVFSVEYPKEKRLTGLE